MDRLAGLINFGTSEEVSRELTCFMTGHKPVNMK